MRENTFGRTWFRKKAFAVQRPLREINCSQFGDSYSGRHMITIHPEKIFKNIYMNDRVRSLYTIVISMLSASSFVILTFFRFEV